MPVPSNVRSRYRGYSSVGFLFLSSLQRVGRNICIYNIVYVYRTAVDGLSGHMFGGFTSRTPPFPVLLGWMCPSRPCLFLFVKVQHMGTGRIRPAGLLNVWVDLPCVAIG